MPRSQDTNGAFDMHKAMELASSPAGQHLLAILQAQAGPELQKAMAKAASGDYSSAKHLLSGFMEIPEIQKLLKQLEG